MNIKIKIMLEKEFIEKVKRQSGYIGVIDAYRLIHFYTEKWGVIYTELPVEDELTYMWLKLQEDLPIKKVCRSCDKEKSINDFHLSKTNKDKRINFCKVCVARKARIKRYGFID